MALSGIAEGVAGNALWGALKSLVGFSSARRKITIRLPRSGELLQGRQPHGSDEQYGTYPVEGFLNHLPKDREIWLLVQDLESGNVWPQEPRSIEFDQQTKIWKGRIVTKGRAPIKIHAVLAPPTSQDLFRFYRSVGSQTGWKPLRRVPVECVNGADVQVKLS